MLIAYARHLGRTVYAVHNPQKPQKNENTADFTPGGFSRLNFIPPSLPTLYILMLYIYTYTYIHGSIHLL